MGSSPAISKGQKREIVPPAASKATPKGKTHASKKRKATKVVSLEVDDSEPLEALVRITYLSQSVVDHVRKYAEGLKSQLEEADQRADAFNERESLLEKLNVDLTMQVKKLTKEKKEMELAHAKELEEVIEDTRISDKAVVLESQIKMGKEAGTDKQGSWDPDAWKVELGRLVGEEVDPSLEPGPAEGGAGEGDGREEKAKEVNQAEA